ncbi:unnamed protein product, partial [Lymnaea stagnalis]
DDKKKGGKGSYDDELPPFPMIGYPVLLGFDPWMMNGGPNWGMFGRRRREKSDEKGLSRAKRDASEDESETNDRKNGDKRDETARTAGQDKEGVGASKSSDPQD